MSRRSHLMWPFLVVVFLTTTAFGPSTDHANIPASEEPAPPSSSSLSSSTCASCHTSIAREWAASSHHRSASNASYANAVEREPLPFCRGCHAPKANPLQPTPAALREEGIGCTDCHRDLAPNHFRDSKVGVEAATAAAKKKTRSRAYACASCHEFAFPSGIGLMQMTEREHAASAFATTSCEACHMRALEKPLQHHDHRFEVAPLLSQAIESDVARASPTRVAFRLRPKTIGHAFPTGDLFRRISVRAGNAAEQFLARHFKTQRVANGAHAKVDDYDDRIGTRGQPACFELDAGPRTEGQPIHVAIALEHVEQPRSANPSDAEVSARFVVWEGVIEPVSPEEFRPCR